MKGRKPKPVELKKLEGREKKTELKGERLVKPDTFPRCPKWLDKIAKAEWKRVAPVLKKIGLLSQLDRTALAGYCYFYSLFKKAVEKSNQTPEILKTKAGQEYLSPYVKLAFKCVDYLKIFCSEFGFTPSSRGRMQLNIQNPQEDDEMEKLLSEN